MAKAPKLQAEDLHGVIGFMLTPVKEGEVTATTRDAVDLDEAARATDALIRDGVTALCLNGTFGELPSLTWEELRSFTAAVVEAARSRVPVFAGATTLNTRDSISRAGAFRDLGAAGLLLGRPMMSVMSDQNTVRFYRDVAQALPDMAIFLYDDMEAFKRPLTTAVYRELAQIPQIIAGKYRTRLLLSSLVDNTFNADLEVVGSRVRLLPGEFDWYFAHRLYGIDVCWSSAVCGGPAPIMALRDAINHGESERALTLTREIAQTYEGLIPQGAFDVWHLDKIPFMKARFAAAGYMKPGPALPPYQYLAPDRLRLACECGRRARELQDKYSRAAAASAPLEAAAANQA